MKRQSLLYCAVLVFVMGGGTALAVWVPIDAAIATPPTVVVVSNDNSGTLIDVRIHGFMKQPKVVGCTLWDEITLPGEGNAELDSGKPQLPQISRLLGIPDGAQATDSVLPLDSVFFGNILCYPYQGQQYEDSAYQFFYDTSFYAQDVWYPDSSCTEPGTGVWRDLSVASIEAYPFKYDPLSRQLKVYSHYQLSVHYAGGGYVHKIVQPWAGSLYANNLLNFGWLDVAVDPIDPPGIQYLVICHDDFARSVGLRDLVSWHNCSGIPTQVVTDVGGWTTDHVRNAIREFYSSNRALRWVLLVGDTSRIPFYNGHILCHGTSRDVSSDFGYSSFETPTPDRLPEISVMRLSVVSALDLDNQTRKVLTYDQPDPPLDWLERMCEVAHRAFRTRMETVRETINTNGSHFWSYEDDNGTPSIWGDAGGTNGLVSNEINYGTNILLYVGHGCYEDPSQPGYRTSWLSWNEQAYPNNYWLVSDIQALGNSDRTPIVLQSACDVGRVGWQPCLTEEWMRKTPGGAVACMGANRGVASGHPWLDPDLAKCLGGYDDQQFDLGWIQNAWLVKAAVENDRWPDPLGFIWLGDPAMNVWMGGVPVQPEVTCPTSIGRPGPCFVHVRVYAPGGRAVEGARICFCDPSNYENVYVTAVTDWQGAADFNVQSPCDTELLVSISGGHAHDAPHTPILPWSRYCLATIELPILVLESFTIDDNDDGILEPGETGRLSVSVRNSGGFSAIGCECTLKLETPDEFVSIQEPVRALVSQSTPDGRIPRYIGTGQTQPNGFAFSVSPCCPDEHEIHFTLRCTDRSGERWDIPLSVPVKAIIHRVGDAFATYPTQARHLVRRPNSNELHIAYQGNGHVYHMQSPNGGASWSPPDDLGIGANPCISLDLAGCPWVTYLDGNSLYFRQRRIDGTWHDPKLIYGEPISYTLGDISSFVCSNLGPVTNSDMGYVVFSRFPVQGLGTARDVLTFVAFDTLQPGYYPNSLCEVDTALAGTHCFFSPCIARTPGDLIHIVWQRGASGNPDYPDSIMYQTTLTDLTPSAIRQGQFPQWDAPLRISPLDQPEANSPFVEAWGDSAFVVYSDIWRVEGQGAADVQRKGRQVDVYYPEVWLLPANQSMTPGRSGDPTMSTRMACAWDEDDCGIRLRFVDDQNSSSLYAGAPNSISYPSTEVQLPPPPPVQGDAYIRVLFTQCLAPNCYGLKLKGGAHIPSGITSAFYSVGVGDSVQSSYCLARDGAKQYSECDIDYASCNLEYELRHLNPMYHYRARLVVYHEDPTTCRECAAADSACPQSLTIQPRNMETLWVELPPESYQEASTRLSITKIAGREAVLADLQVFQYEVINGGGGGGQGQGASPIAQATKLMIPTLAAPGVRISYQVAAPTEVALSVVDIAGRTVRVLERSHACKPGRYSVAWDATDNAGKRLPGGVYFCCLEKPGQRIVRKLLLVR